VDVVVDVGGVNTLPQSLIAARVGGAIVIIGVLSGWSQNIMIPVLFSKNLRLNGISVGSREEFAAMAASIDKWKLKPVIDKTYRLEDLPAALERMQAGAHFGKICLAF
jgi:NADPH:quinone reductase-like Zn-dependent oxidoreductase